MEKTSLLLLIISICGLASALNVTIPANTEWTDTGVYLQVGQAFSIAATGKWRYDPRPQFETGPGGVYAKGDMAGPGGRGALQGKIGGGAPWMVATNWSGVAVEGGELYLGMTDGPNQYYDNVGEVYAEIEVVPGQQTPQPNVGNATPAGPVVNQSNANNQSQQQDTSSQNQVANPPAYTPPGRSPEICSVGLVVLGFMLLFEFARERVAVR